MQVTIEKGEGPEVKQVSLTKAGPREDLVVNSQQSALLAAGEGEHGSPVWGGGEIGDPTKCTVGSRSTHL